MGLLGLAAGGLVGYPSSSPSHFPFLSEEYTSQLACIKRNQDKEQDDRFALRGDSLRGFALSAAFTLSCRATRAASEASQVFSPVQMLALKRGWRTRDSVSSSEAPDCHR
jgi:hypothetical protein